MRCKARGCHSHCGPTELELSAVLVKRLRTQIRGTRAAQCAVLVMAMMTCLAGSRVRASEIPAPTEVPLVQFLQRAATDNPYLAAGRIDVLAAQAGQDAVTGYRFGHLYGQLMGGPVPGAQGNAVSSTNPVNRAGYVVSDLGLFFRANLNYAVPLWTFGKIDAGARAVGELVEAKKAQSETQAWDVITQIKALYFAWILTDESTCSTTRFRPTWMRPTAISKSTWPPGTRT